MGIEIDQESYIHQLQNIIREAKVLAKSYRLLTGRPLGITGEVAEIEAANILRLNLADVRTAGYDATAIKDDRLIKYQIKGRCILDDAKPGQRVGGIKLDHDWDAVLLVLLDKDLETIEIIEAQRTEVEMAIKVPGSKARNERGALSVNKFKSIGQSVWRRNG